MILPDDTRIGPPTDTGECYGEDCGCREASRDIDAVCNQHEPRWIDNPAVKGGQGRTEADMDRATMVFAWVAGISFGLGTLALLWWLTLKAAGVVA